jgi:hypothetical protein
VRRAASRLCVLACLLGAAPAAAREVSGKWGLGYESTLTALGTSGISGSVAPVSASGLAFRIYSGHLGLEAVGGGAFRSVPNGKAETRAFVALGVLYNVFRSPSANLAAGVRGVVGLLNNLVTDELDASGQRIQHAGTSLGVTVEMPLRAEYFFSDNFAISGAVGPVLEFNRSDANPLTGGSAFGLDIFRGGFSGGVGFTVYFR